jgi:purine-cytosine permease-like protein
MPAPVAAQESEQRHIADHAAEALPIEARMPRFALAMAWWGICSAMVYLFIGAALALTYGARNAVIGMVLAVISFGLLCGFLARFSARTGLSSSALSQAMLGRAGGAVATVILAATGVYYAVFEGSVLAVAMAKVIPGLSYGWAAFIVVAYSVPLVLGSVQNWINRLNGVLLPFYLLGMLALAIVAFTRHGEALDVWGVGPPGPDPAFGWWFCFATYLGILVMAMCTMDFARFARPDDERYHARFTFGMPFYAITYLLNGVVGVLIVATLESTTITETAVVDASLALLGAWIGLGWVLVSQTRINTANFLIGTLNLQAFATEAFGWRVSKLACATLIGVVTFALMRSTDVFKYLLTALNFQAILTTAWVGVALSYVATLRNGIPNGTRRNAGLIAWWVATGCGGVTFFFGGSTGAFWYPVVTLSAAVIAHRTLLARARTTPTTSM